MFLLSLLQPRSHREQRPRPQPGLVQSGGALDENRPTANRKRGTRETREKGEGRDGRFRATSRRARALAGRGEERPEQDRASPGPRAAGGGARPPGPDGSHAHLLPPARGAEPGWATRSERRAVPGRGSHGDRAKPKAAMSRGRGSLGPGAGPRAGRLSADLSCARVSPTCLPGPGG